MRWTAAAAAGHRMQVRVPTVRGRSDVRAGPSAMSTRFSQRAYLVLGQRVASAEILQRCWATVGSLRRGAGGVKYIPVLLIFLWSYFEPLPILQVYTSRLHLSVHSLTYSGNPSLCTTSFHLRHAGVATLQVHTLGVSLTPILSPDCLFRSLHSRYTVHIWI